MSHVILSVTNSIGKIKCNEFKEYLKKFAIHWVKSFGRWRTLKNSLHWSLAHCAQLVAQNEAYSLAEYSENSLEALIKRYRYVTKNLARQTSFVDNSRDCLKVLYIQSLYQIRKHENKLSNTTKKLDDPEAEQINQFFMEGECYTSTGNKWTRPNLTQDYS